MIFNDRHEAGIELAKKLAQYRGKKDVIVLAIPRGGLEVGFEIARMLSVPLDIVVTKKISYPGDPEFAIGAASADDFIVDNEFEATADNAYLHRQVSELRKRIKEVYEKYRKGMKQLPVKGKTVIICDDGLATGHTALAAVRLLKKQGVKKIVVAVPVAPQDTIDRIRAEAEVVCLHVPHYFIAIGEFYRHFPQLTDEEAMRYLNEANKISKE